MFMSPKGETNPILRRETMDKLPKYLIMRLEPKSLPRIQLSDTGEEFLPVEKLLEFFREKIPTLEFQAYSRVNPLR